MYTDVSSIDRALEEIYANYVPYTSHYRDLGILEAKIQELDAKLDKALKVMNKTLKEIKQNEHSEISN